MIDSSVALHPILLYWEMLVGCVDLLRVEILHCKLHGARIRQAGGWPWPLRGPDEREWENNENQRTRERWWRYYFLRLNNAASASEMDGSAKRHETK